MEDPIVIQPLQARHARAAAEIHVLSQKGTFLTSLGRDFLTVLYEQMSQSSYSISYAATQNEEVVGFLVGAVQTKAIFKEVVTKRFFRLSWLVFKRALSRPALLWQALKTLAYPGELAEDTPEAELLALALEPTWRNNGIGGHLVRQFREGMEAAGVARIAVTVDGDNDGALRFYRRYGFERAFDFEMYGRPMVNLIVDLR